MNNPVTNNPNATTALLAGGGLGTLLLEVFEGLGWDIEEGTAVLLASGIAAVALFIGKNGVKGAWRRVMNGTGALLALVR